jgi:AMIN domain
MQLTQNLWLISVLALLSAPAYSQAVRQVQVQKVSVNAQGPLQFQVQTSARVAPQAQIIADPERLVIDIPGAVPGSGLRVLTVNRNEVTRVRVGLFSTDPPVTRIVLDLNAPEWYRITPSASGFTVSLGAEQSNPTVDSGSQPTIGWVSQKIASTRTGGGSTAPVVRTISASVQAPANGVRVRFTNGQLEIHAHNATLSEVLFQIQKQTGAEIAIPAGTEQERVVVDSGPGLASAVLADLLNGSGLNFVVVGSESDPKVLRSVILSRKSGFAEYVPAYTPPQTATNIPPDNSEMNIPAEENTAQPEPSEPPSAAEAPPN